MNFLNLLMIKSIQILPKSFVYKIAGRYVAGINDNEAINTVKKLNKLGFHATLDILGEHTKSINKAEEITNSYKKLFHLIKANKLNCNISVKPTHIGLDISLKTFELNVRKIAKDAIETDNFLRIDMESSNVTTQTIKSTLDIQNDYINVGTVLQAYLYRTKNDIDLLTKNQNKQNLRLCKGIYKESENIAIQSRNEINNNYINLFKHLIKKGCYVGIATHDQELITEIYSLINKLKINSSQFEFQVLYGVPIGNWLNKHLENGYKVRVYVPFGEDWYDYSIRRLRENPNIAIYILKNLFKK